MYVFGLDVPLMELIIAIGVIGIIILLEITIILILITYHMKNSRKLESQIGTLIQKLMQLEGKELKQLEKMDKMTQEEKGLITRLKKMVVRPEKKPVKPLTARQRKRLYKKITKKKEKNKLLKNVDKFLKRFKK